VREISKLQTLAFFIVFFSGGIIKLQASIVPLLKSKNKFMSKEKESILLETKNEQIEKPDYSADEIIYLGGIRKRAESAKIQRDQEHDEFDGMSYLTYYDVNERLANTFIQPKKNKEDTNFQSGTIRQKLFALLSSLTNLDLTGDISAFDADGFEIQAMGDGMEDIILKTKELDNDDEKKFLRHYELLKHGTVFVEELWSEKSKKEKKAKKKFEGKVKGFDYVENIKKAFARPTRNIIPGINVYLGDITKYDISDQPYILTVDAIPYEEAKTIFGKWERWDNVPKKLTKFDSTNANTVFNNEWTLLSTQENYVEIVRYQDKWNNEFALLLNGVLMTPIGLSLTDLWGYEDYNIAQQNLEPIHAKFAYGKSLVARIKNKVALFDEMMRLAILKTQKSFMPPYINLSGRILSNKVFMPGKITHGIPAQSLVPISEKEVQGLTVSELNMIKELQESINSETTSPTFAGQQAEGNPTATEIIEMQRQAKMMLGMTMFSVLMLEWKLEWLRLKNILANWFQPEDEVVDKMRGILKSKYRKTTTERTIEGEGVGKRMVIPTKEIPSSEAIMKTEDQLTQEQGMPIRLIFVNPEEITNAKLIWQIVITPKEKKTSELNKLMFRAFMQDAQLFTPMLNLDYLSERFASIWGENSSKLFSKQNQMQIGPDGQPIQPMQQGGTVSPNVKMPQPSVQKEMNNQLKTGI
jgi:hypothetical protein